MFERGEEETATKLADEAKQKAHSIDANVPQAKKVISESTEDKPNGIVSEYLSELSRK